MFGLPTKADVALYSLERGFLAAADIALEASSRPKYANMNGHDALVAFAEALRKAAEAVR